MARELANSVALSLQEQLYVERVVETGDFDLAFTQAGFSQASPQWRKTAATLARKPAVVLAIHKAIARQLVADAATARRVAMQIMTDEGVTPKVRADLAVKILRMGGHVEPKQEQRDTTGDKSLAELSMQELRDRAEALERELSERAKPVISATAVPAADDPSDMFE
jgi:hypothetical protein